MPKINIPLGIKHLPSAPPFRKIIGPSFILLGLGLGSGEVILWPYLASNYGLGMIWGMVVGITMQFFINMEVERYALINGESVFVGFKRLFRYLPYWFALSTFIGFGWPGIGLASASLISKIFNYDNPDYLAVALFIAIGAALSLGKVLYKTVERIQTVLICVSIPLILILTFYVVDFGDVVSLFKGIIGQGDGYSFLPIGVAMGSFLGALAYSGAGGNLNLAQSFYIRDKGYGMGYHAEKITSIFTHKVINKELHLTGNTFPITTENLRRFAGWWRVTNIEHFVVFWVLGLFTMMMLSLLAYSTTYGLENNLSGINFVINEAAIIGQLTFPILAPVFLLVLGTVLAATQLTVLDSTSRIITENSLLAAHKHKTNIAKLYYIILWSQIAFSIFVVLIGFDQPLQLITLGAVINAFSMFFYSGLLFVLNNYFLKKHLRPSLIRNMAIIGTFIFFGVFCTKVIIDLFTGG